MRLFLADEEESSTTILKTTVVSVKTQGHREQTLNCCCFDCCFGVGGVGAEATMTAAMKAAAAAAAVPSVDFTLSPMRVHDAVVMPMLMQTEPERLSAAITTAM